MPNLRERIVTAAYPLFAERGLKDVTEAEIGAAAGITAAELATVFPSRNSIAAACLVQRENELTVAVIEAGARARGVSPETRLLAVFDVLEEWFQSDDEEPTAFLAVLIGLREEQRPGRATADAARTVREIIGTLAREAGLREPERFALSFHVLIKASMLSAIEGDTVSGVCARDMGRELIRQHRPSSELELEAARTGGTWFGDPSFDLYDFTGAAPIDESSVGVLDWYDAYDMDRGQD